MPKVASRIKSKAGKEYHCDLCPSPIVAGDKYYEWKFRYGGTHRQHTAHGAPKPSQLTQSKLSGVYAAIESAQMSIDAAEDVEGLRQALEDCRGEVESVRDEYQKSLDNIPENLREGASGSEMTDKIEQLESFMEALESNDLEDFDEEEPENEPPEMEAETESEYQKRMEAHDKAVGEWEERKEDHLEAQKDIARQTLEEELSL